MDRSFLLGSSASERFSERLFNAVSGQRSRRTNFPVRLLGYGGGFTWEREGKMDRDREYGISDRLF